MAPFGEPVDYYVMQRPGEGKLSDGAYPDARYRIDTLTGQDVMAIETQGGVTSRHNWRLGTGDRGVMLYERMLQREMERVQQGHDPHGVAREPDLVIDTNCEAFLHAGGKLALSHEGLQVYCRSDSRLTMAARAR